MKTSLLISLLIIWGCTGKNKEGNQVSEGHEELYSLPSAPATLEEGVTRVVVAATNDIHGHYGPVNLDFKDKHNSKEQSISVGGVDYLSAYLKILRETYQNVVLVDSGDIFPNNRRFKDVTEFYEDLKYDAITYGLNDFNLPQKGKGPEKASLIKEFAADVKTPVLLSNLYALRSARGVEWKGVKPYIVKELNGIKVGILGVVPDDVVALTPVDNRIGLYVESMIQNTLHYARLLRSLGAELVVVITHHGLECGKEVAQTKKLPLEKVNFDPAKENACELSGTLGEYIKRLPPELVDVVVGGRHHQKMANIVNGVVVLSGFEDGKSLNLAEFYFDKKSGNLLPEKTVVQQPVMICHQFFKESKDCYPGDPSVDHTEKMPATFLGKEVSPDEVIRKDFKSYFKSTSTQQQKSASPEAILSQLQADLIFTHSLTSEAQLLSFEMKGKDLIRTLEEEYNNGASGNWMPSPYSVKNSKLRLLINNKPIASDNTYKVLADLKSLQNSFQLRSLISRSDTKSHPYSWSSIEIDSDKVNLQMAASQRQKARAPSH